MNKKYYMVGEYDPKIHPPLDGMVYLMQWTTEPPTKEGWYWAVDANDNETMMQVVVVEKNYGTDKDAEPLVVGAVYGSEEWKLSYFTHWLGPLPAPEPPK